MGEWLSVKGLHCIVEEVCLIKLDSDETDEAECNATSEKGFTSEAVYIKQFERYNKLAAV